MGSEMCIRDRSYTLEIVDKGSVTDRQVVGTCGGGTKEIVYQRN